MQHHVKRLLSSDSVIHLVAFATVAAALATLEVGSWRIFAAFALLVAASEMFEVTLRNGTVYSLGLAPALGYALLPERAASATILAFAVGAVLAAIVRLGNKEDSRLTDAAIHLLALAAAAVALAGVQRALPIYTGPSDALETGFLPLLTGVLVMLAAIIGIETLLRGIRRATSERLVLRTVLIDGLRSTTALHLSTLSVGTLLALSHQALGTWAFPLFLAPLAATHMAFRQLEQIKKTYLQTIRALSKVPEMAGYTAQGHSTRVAELATAVARELGVNEEEVSEIEYAALLHDIGRVSLPDPDIEEPAALEVAAVGATIVRETGHFPRVADMIEHQHLMYRRRGEGTDPNLSVGARAIKVANAYDEMTHHGTVGLSARDALDRLRRGLEFDYDPVVVMALTRVLEKRGVL